MIFLYNHIFIVPCAHVDDRRTLRRGRLGGSLYFIRASVHIRITMRLLSHVVFLTDVKHIRADIGLSAM